MGRMFHKQYTHRTVTYAFRVVAASQPAFHAQAGPPAASFAIVFPAQSGRPRKDAPILSRPPPPTSKRIVIVIMKTCGAVQCARASGQVRGHRRGAARRGAAAPSPFLSTSTSTDETKTKLMTKTFRANSFTSRVARARRERSPPSLALVSCREGDETESISLPLSLERGRRRAAPGLLIAPHRLRARPGRKKYILTLLFYTLSLSLSLSLSPRARALITMNYVVDEASRQVKTKLCDWAERDGKRPAAGSIIARGRFMPDEATKRRLTLLARSL